MEVSRRQFIQLGGTAAAAATVPTWTGEPEGLRPAARWRARTVADMPAPDLPALLLNRAAFGPRPGEVEEVREKGANWWIERQLDYESIDNTAVETRLLQALPTLQLSARQLLNVGQNQRVAVRELQLATVYRMAFSPRLLHEVMTEFWTDHFSMDINSELVEYFKTADDRDVVRKHALGNFKELLTASAMSPAMLNYLNNDVSTKERPNENYAREIMELHSLGVANKDGYPYSEQDVKEVAKCFTGWSWDNKQGSQTRGEFEYRDAAHHSGSKEVLGEFIPAAMKMQDGHAVIEILCAHKATGDFLAKKLVRRFVTDDPEGQTPDLMKRVSQAYYDSKYDIRTMVRTILMSKEFAASFSTYGGRLSRPMDLIARMLRTADVQPEQFDLNYTNQGGGLYQRLYNALVFMGHVPYIWPTPDGYPDYKEAWSASTNLLTRWNLGLALNGVGSRTTGFGPALIPNFVLAQKTPTTLTTAGQVVDYWIERLVHRQFLPEDRDYVIQYLTNGGPASTPMSDALAAKLPETIALIYDSPYFQWR